MSRAILQQKCRYFIVVNRQLFTICLLLSNEISHSKTKSRRQQFVIIKWKEASGNRGSLEELGHFFTLLRLLLTLILIISTCLKHLLHLEIFTNMSVGLIYAQEHMTYNSLKIIKNLAQLSLLSGRLGPFSGRFGPLKYIWFDKAVLEGHNIFNLWHSGHRSH